MDVLHILPSFQPGGGMERVVMNWFGSLDHAQFHFDVLTHAMEDRAYADALEGARGTVTALPPFSLHSLEVIAASYDELLTENHYDVVHCHMANAAFLYLRLAKRHGVPLRIVHSHQERYADTRLHALRNMPLVALGKRYANAFAACSEASGQFLFKGRPFTLVGNAIDVSSFMFDAAARARVRRQLGVNADTLLMGFVGRLAPQKNPTFALRVLKEACTNVGSHALLAIAGEGDLGDELRLEAKRLGIEEQVIWLGTVRDIAALYCALDALIMPSHYEGLPMALVEAQASGVPCMVSDAVTSEAVVDGIATMLPLAAGPAAWAEVLLQADAVDGATRLEAAGKVRDAGFDSSVSIGALIRLYRQAAEGGGEKGTK